MAKREIDISLDGVWDDRRPARSRIDIPLGDGEAGDAITRKELEFVNRHHEEYKEMRRRMRQQGGR